MTIASNKNTPRNTYVASGGQTTFTIGFEFFQVADVKVYKNGTLLTYHADPTTSSQYKITGAVSDSDEAYEFGAGGSVILGAGATANDSIVIIRDLTIERTQDFPAVGSFDITALNTQLDTITSMIAEQDTYNSRSVRLADTDVDSATLTLPNVTTRASKLLEFDSSGNVATTITTTGLQTLSGLTSEIIAVAGQITPVNNISTVAGIDTEIASVAGINSQIVNVSSISADITTAALNIVAIQNASTNATNAANSATAASNSATASANSATASANSATASANAQTAAELARDQALVAADNFDDTYLGAKSADPTTDNDGDPLSVGDLFFLTTTNNLRVYNGTAWEDAAVSTSGFATTGLSIAMAVAL